MFCSLSGSPIHGCMSCSSYGMCSGPVYRAEPETLTCVICGAQKQSSELAHGICDACKTDLLESHAALLDYALAGLDDFLSYCADRAARGDAPL